MDSLIFENESYAIRGAAMDVYNNIGSGFLEAVYQECLEREFLERKIPFQSQVDLPIEYKGKLLTQLYRADFICYGSIIVELKAVKEIASEHKAQILNYLKATNLQLGLLINFGSHPKVQFERYVV